MDLATFFLLLFGAYGVAGVAVGAWFVLTQVHRVDHAAAGASWGFRAIVFPGSCALWPLVLRWSLRAATNAKHARDHNTAANALASHGTTP
jgi:hypothetical protein